MSPRTTTRHRGPITDYRPHAATEALLAQVEAVLVEYAEYLPLTIRQVFYRLVARYLYEKTERAYSRLCEHLGNARCAGRIPWESIRDDGVTEDAPEGFTGKADFWRTVKWWAEDYRRDRLAGQAKAVQVWCEAAGMVPQLARVAHPYGIPVFSSSGFDSRTFRHKTGELAGKMGRPLVVLHVGDHDPSGVHVFTSAAEDVDAWATHYGGAVEFHRVAITPAQVAHYDLPTAPPKPTDRRSFEGLTTQAEALDPATLATIVGAAIEAVVDEETLARVLAVEEAERAELVAITEGR